MPVNLPPKATYCWMKRIRMRRLACIGHLEICDTLHRIGSTSSASCYRSEPTRNAFTRLFARAVMLMLPQRCEGMGKRSNSVLFASKDETLWPSDG